MEADPPDNEAPSEGHESGRRRGDGTASKLTRKQLIELVDKIRSGSDSEEELHGWIVVLEANLIDPR